MSFGNHVIFGRTFPPPLHLFIGRSSIYRPNERPTLAISITPVPTHFVYMFLHIVCRRSFRHSQVSFFCTRLCTFCTQSFLESNVRSGNHRELGRGMGWWMAFAIPKSLLLAALGQLIANNFWTFRMTVWIKTSYRCSSNSIFSYRIYPLNKVH